MNIAYSNDNANIQKIKYLLDNPSIVNDSLKAKVLLLNDIVERKANKILFEHREIKDTDKLVNILLNSKTITNEYSKKFGSKIDKHVKLMVIDKFQRIADKYISRKKNCFDYISNLF